MIDTRRFWNLGLILGSAQRLNGLKNDGELSKATARFIEALPAKSSGPCAQRIRSYEKSISSIAESLYAMADSMAAVLDAMSRDVAAMDKAHAASFGGSGTHGAEAATGGAHDGGLPPNGFLESIGWPAYGQFYDGIPEMTFQPQGVVRDFTEEAKAELSKHVALNDFAVEKAEWLIENTPDILVELGMALQAQPYVDDINWFYAHFLRLKERTTEGIEEIWNEVNRVESDYESEFAKDGAYLVSLAREFRQLAECIAPADGASPLSMPDHGEFRKALVTKLGGAGGSYLAVVGQLMKDGKLDEGKLKELLGFGAKGLTDAECLALLAVYKELLEKDPENTSVPILKGFLENAVKLDGTGILGQAQEIERKWTRAQTGSMSEAEIDGLMNAFRDAMRAIGGDYDNFGGLQCVDLTRWYVDNYTDFTSTSGHAGDLATNIANVNGLGEPSNALPRAPSVFSSRDGKYHAVAINPETRLPYGHTGIVVAVDGNQLTVIETSNDLWVGGNGPVVKKSYIPWTPEDAVKFVYIGSE